MRAAYAQDAPYDETTTIRDALVERPGKPIRLRIQPTIWRTHGKDAGSYRHWRAVSWVLECDTIDEVNAFKEAMRAFFAYATTHGPTAARARLTAPVETGKEVA